MSERIFADLEQKVERLFIRYNQLRDTNEQLQQTIQQLERENAELLQQQVNIEDRANRLIDRVDLNTKSIDSSRKPQWDDQKQEDNFAEYQQDNEGRFPSNNGFQRGETPHSETPHRRP